jgi:hypothetical protein
VLPSAQLIYLVRHPIERMRSQYIHEVARGKQTLPINEALLNDPRYVDYSRYELQIQQYMSYFRPEQMLIIQSEKLNSERRATLHRILEFLRLNHEWWSPILESEFHRSASKRRPIALARATRRVRRLYTYRAAAQRAPRFVKDINRWIMTRGIDPRAAIIPDPLRRHLELQLRDDIRALACRLGDGFDGWGLI